MPQAKDELEKTKLKEAKSKEAPKASKDPTEAKAKDGGGSFGENIKAAFSKRTKAEPAASSKPVLQKLQPGQGRHSMML